MGATVNIKKIITAKLKAYSNSVYYVKAKKASGTYVVFEFDAWKYDEVGTDMLLVVNVIGTGQDPATVDNLADSIWSGFNHLYYIDSVLDTGVVIYQNARSAEAADDGVIHRRLVFNMRVF